MNRKQAEQIVMEYLKKIYGFVLKKVANLQDAEDLTQEIVIKLYNTLLVNEIDNTSAFVWRVTRNTLANYYRGRARGGIGICIDELAEVLSNEDDVYESFIKGETIKRLQSEIAYLSKIQRKIVVLYYYEGKKQDEIARLLDISVGTVKWHLFEAKSEMKKGMEIMRNVSELKFNPIKFDLMGVNGSVGTMGSTANFFRSTLSQNIAYCVWKESKTINEVADCLGVSPVYVEGEVEFLEEYGFLIKKGKKYLANLLIDEPTTKLNTLQSSMYEEAAKLYANDLYDELIKSECLHHEGIYYPDGDVNFLMWTIIFYIAALSGEKLMGDKVTFEEAATVRSDGGHNIACASVIDTSVTPPKYYENIKQWYGPCWNTVENLILWQIDTEWSTKRVDDGYANNARYDLLLLERFLNEDTLSVDEYAHMAKKGYIKIESSPDEPFKASLKIVWIRDKEAQKKLLKIGDRLKEKYHDQFNALKAPFVKSILESTPKHLHKMRAYGLQFTFFADGWFLLHCAQELVKNGKLKPPTEEQKKTLTTLVFSNR